MTHEINMNRHQEVEVKKKNDISFKASTIVEKDGESGNEDQVWGKPRKEENFIQRKNPQVPKRKRKSW